MEPHGVLQCQQELVIGPRPKLNIHLATQFLWDPFYHPDLRICITSWPLPCKFSGRVK
jgi:hypothetical protein